MNFKMTCTGMHNEVLKTVCADYFTTSKYCGTETVVAVFGENHHEVYPWNIVSIEKR